MKLALLSMFPVLAGGAAELRFALHTDPKTLDPILAADEASETIAYLTGGVLIRLNRQTQQLEGELAESWKVRDGGKRVDFVLRNGVQSSNGVPFGPKDVVSVISRLSDPGLRSAIADSFRAGTGEVKAEVTGPHEVTVSFTAPVANVELLFDQLVISNTLGPFVLAEYKRGQYVLLRRNTHYWKSGDSGRKLPYADAVRIQIVANRETELLRFRKGELHFVDKLEPEMFDRLRKELPGAARDAGASLDSEMLWFNQAPNAPLPAPRREWFQSKRFRRALSVAIQRDDMVRLVYRGYAEAAAGPVSQSNRQWFNPGLHPPAYNPAEALRLLEQDQFRLDRGKLRDRNGNPVEFSVITNAGSPARLRLATMLQQDFQKIGIALNIVPLEFQSLVERLSETRDYESCLLGFTNVELDPNEQMNVWLSSSTHHAWNPAQKTPATAWEAEIDRLMRTQATASSPRDRKKAFDRVQEILVEEAPILYLVNPHVLVAVSPLLGGVAPSVLPPHLFWNAERLSPAPDRGGRVMPPKD